MIPLEMKNKSHPLDRTHDTFFGYVIIEGQYDQPTKLEGTQAVANFVTTHLHTEELKVCDSSDHLLLHLMDGVDIYNELEEININLNELFINVRQALIEKEEEQPPKERWEILYDQIGLSAGEIAMRQRVKKAAQAATSVADVAELVRGTYFDARFYSIDDMHCWGYFDDADLSVCLLYENENDRRIQLKPDARVQHRSSAEDVHVFTLLDIP